MHKTLRAFCKFIVNYTNKNREGVCELTNAQLAEKFKTKKVCSRQIQKYLKSLIQEKYLLIEGQGRSRQIFTPQSRTIYELTTNQPRTNHELTTNSVTL